MKWKHVIAAVFLLLFYPMLPAMEMNLAGKYDPTPSPPQDGRIHFSVEGNGPVDFLFKGARPIAINCHVGLRAVAVKWQLSRNMFVQPFMSGTAVAQPANNFSITLSTDKLLPGFYDLRVTVDCGTGKPLSGICTFGYEVKKISVPRSRPTDFNEFWNKQKALLNAIPLDAQEENLTTFDHQQINDYNLAYATLPADYDPAGHKFETVESGKVTFTSAGGKRIHGWLAKPQGKGPFPAMLVLPGAGFAARPRPLEHARHGFLALDIQIQGQDVDAPTYPKLPGYYTDIVYEPIDQHYYRDVYLHVLQALKYLRSRPDVDSSRIVVVGGSQGGRLTIVTAALDGEIAAAIPAIAHYANMPYLAWAKTSNAQTPQHDGMTGVTVPPFVDTPETRCVAYYDIMNFAPDVRCPVLMNAGLIDPISNATGVFTTFNQLGTKHKTMIALPGLGHDWSAEFDRRAWRWLDEILSSRPAKKR